MVNPNFTDLADRKQNKATPPSQGVRSPAPIPPVIEKTANWPTGGPTQPRNRSLGIKQVKIHPKKEGF